VGERIMAASLAQAAGMQLQVEPQAPLPGLAEQLLTHHLLTQPGPWDAGIIAARVSSSGSGSSSSGSSSGASQGCSSRGESSGSAGSWPAQADEQGVTQAAPSLLRVELVAAFTSPSFAVGYLGCTSSSSGSSSSSSSSRRQGLREVQTLRCNNAAAAPAGGAAGGMLSVEQQQPGVTAMEVCCTWPR
jgi:hypothetical protein